MDQRIYQGCKMNPHWPYGLLLARIGNGSAQQMGRAQSFHAWATGALSLRIHDGDGCLADNNGSLVVRIRPGADPWTVLRSLIPALNDAKQAGDYLGYALQQMNNLTTQESARLAGLAKNIGDCEASLVKKVPTYQCDAVIIALYDFFINPQQVD